MILKKILLLPVTFILFLQCYSQLSFMKMVGKNAEAHKPGIGIFYFLDIPVNAVENNSIIIELFDFGNFSVKNSYGQDPVAYLSIKAGFRHIFSEENKTGFFIEPQAGYGWVTADQAYTSLHGGFALAMIAGYSKEVGYSGNSFVFGFKYETDLPGNNRQISTIGLRFTFNYNLKNY